MAGSRLIIGISDRQMRRWRSRYEQYGYDGLFDRRRGKPSPRRVPLGTVEKVLGLYQEKYFDFNVRHFHEKLREEHGLRLSYTWVKLALQGAGLVNRRRKRGLHRQRRPRRPLPGMLLHLDGSQHRWFVDDRWYDLLVVLDDASSEIYYAQLVEQESTRTVLAALREVVEQQGIFCALYSDRASHFFLTRKAGEPVDRQRSPRRSLRPQRHLPVLGRQLREPRDQDADSGLRATSAQVASQRRNFGTWQGRLPQELRLRGIITLEAANRFLREGYIGEFNRRFAVPATQPGSAFLPSARRELDRIFSIQHQRIVNRDNTVSLENRLLQIEKTPWRGTLAGCRVTVYEHLDGTLSIGYAGRTRWAATPPRGWRSGAAVGGGARWLPDNTIWRSPPSPYGLLRSAPNHFR